MIFDLIFVAVGFSPLLFIYFATAKVICEQINSRREEKIRRQICQSYAHNRRSNAC